MFSKVIETKLSRGEFAEFIKQFPHTQASEEKFTLATTVPHSGFGMFGTQVIHGSIEETPVGVRLHARVFPSVSELLKNLLFLALTIYTLTLFCLGKATPLFCFFLSAFTCLSVAFTMWQMKKCLENFAKKFSLPAE